MALENMQKWFSIREYSRDYLQSVYRYYADCGISYVCTYYQLRIPDSVTDLDVLDAGSYELTGDMSGLSWNKILLFPVYNIEQIQNQFVSDERGFGKFDQVSSFNYPTIYGVSPQVHDFVQFEETILNDNNDQYNLGIVDNDHSVQTPIYQVVNFEKATNTAVSFWKCSLKISHITEPKLDSHIGNNFSFFDLEKRIYEADNTAQLFNILEKNKQLNGNKFYKPASGFYYIK